MTKSVLVKGREVLVDDDLFEWASGLKISLQRNYAVFRQSGRGYPASLHRAIVDAPDGVVVDHINGDTLDNRRVNLRLCTASENLRNRKRRSDSASPFKGISWKPSWKKWCASIHANGRGQFLGGFSDPILAALAYDRAASREFGEFARLNFDPSRDWLFPQLRSPEWQARIEREERALRCLASLDGQNAPLSDKPHAGGGA